MQRKELTYFFKFVDGNGISYSVDNITLKFRLVPKYLRKLIKYLRERYDCKENEADTRLFHYHYFFVIMYGKSTMRIELSLNGVDKCRGKIIVNPNKCFDSSECVNDLKTIRSFCNMFELQKLDVALDIYEKKSDVHMMKTAYKSVSYFCGNKKDYKLSKEEKALMKELYDDASNYITEYLGTRGHKTYNGFCKLYNKTFESETSEIITRFEITLKTCGKGCKTIKDIIANLYRLMPKVFITRRTDLSAYTNDSWAKKYMKTLEALVRFNNPYWAVQDIRMENKDKKYSKHLQKKLLSYLNLEYVVPKRDVLEELLDACFGMINDILETKLDDIAEKVPHYFFEEDEDVTTVDLPIMNCEEARTQPLLI